jgi:hypothetical protein
MPWNRAKRLNVPSAEAIHMQVSRMAERIWRHLSSLSRQEADRHRVTAKLWARDKLL